MPARGIESSLHWLAKSLVSCWREVLAEGIGTFILVFAGTGAVMANDVSQGAITHIGISFVFGAVVAALIYSLGHISDAHFNPAVTLAFWSSGFFSKKRVLPYILGQLVGAIALTDNVQPGGALSHLGVQVESTQEVEAAIQRFTDAGLALFTEDDTDCCYALQDKVWVTDPDGNRWEVFVVKVGDTAPEKNVAVGQGVSKPCCG
ncbi:MAG: aquaporin [Nostoc sp. ChiSLP01]|nr:aquaporin [Nostoc sp. CmiSLP01]MDZ8284374.1 aquaporin [Nostoc sp. ChiSLP01]